MDAKLQDLFEYLNEGVSPFHAVAGTARRLEEDVQDGAGNSWKQ